MGSEKERTVSINYSFKEPDGPEGERIETPRSCVKVSKKKKNHFCLLNEKKKRYILMGKH